MLVHRGERLKAELLGDLLEARRVPLLRGCGPAGSRESRSGAWSGASYPPASAVRPNRARTTIPEDRPKDKMPVTLDQILSSTRGRLPGLRARRAAVEREAAGRGSGRPRSRAALRRGRRGGHRRGEASLAVGGLDPRGSRSGRARRALRAPRRRGDLGADRRAVLRRLDRRPPGGRRPRRRSRCCGRTSSSTSCRSSRRGRPGAAAVLLIVRALQRRRGSRRCSPARADAGLDALVEVHTPDELALALDAGATDRGREQPRSRHLPDRHRPSAWTIAPRGAAGLRRRRGERHGERRGRRGRPRRPAPTRCSSAPRSPRPPSPTSCSGG